MSNSGGSFGPDGWLYITGHDTTEVYVIKLPDAGGIALWVATIYTPDIAGQGIAGARSEGTSGSLYSISRESTELVEMQAPLHECEWVSVRVGAIYGPDDVVYLFVYPSD